MYFYNNENTLTCEVIYCDFISREIEFFQVRAEESMYLIEMTFVLDKFVKK